MNMHIGALRSASAGHWPSLKFQDLAYSTLNNLVLVC